MGGSEGRGSQGQLVQSLAHLWRDSGFPLEQMGTTKDPEQRRALSGFWVLKEHWTVRGKRREGEQSWRRCLQWSRLREMMTRPVDMGKGAVYGLTFWICSDV